MVTTSHATGLENTLIESLQHISFSSPISRYGHLGTVKWLETTYEAELDVTTKAGATPLHFAASHGNLDVVKFLVEKNPT